MYAHHVVRLGKPEIGTSSWSIIAVWRSWSHSGGFHYCLPDYRDLSLIGKVLNVFGRKRNFNVNLPCLVLDENLVAHIARERSDHTLQKCNNQALVVPAGNCYLSLVDFRTLLVILFGIVLPALFIFFYFIGQ